LSAGKIFVGTPTPLQSNPEEKFVIQPTRGRVVLFTPHKSDAIPNDGQPLAAIIAHVHSDGVINLTVFDAFGRVIPRPSVPLLQDGDAKPNDGGFAEWMPYQKGQAAKTEQLEQKIAASEQSSGLQPHQQRVVDEKAELDERLGKLIAFFGTPIFTGLVEEERERLAAQERAMGAYSRILADRIAAFV
jgi:hypothetical protein